MGEEINITFETLYDLLRREKGKEELQQLNITFFKDTVTYLQEKIKLVEKKNGDDDLFSVGEKDKLETELRNIKRILKELYDKREKKMIEMALNRSRTGSNIIDTSALLEEEKKFYEQLVGLFDKYRLSILFNVFKGQLPVIAEEKKIEVTASVAGAMTTATTEKSEERVPGVRVRIINPVPKFISPDLKIYGPFEMGLEVELEKSLAELLVEKKRAEFLP